MDGLKRKTAAMVIVLFVHLHLKGQFVFLFNRYFSSAVWASKD